MSSPIWRKDFFYCLRLNGNFTDEKIYNLGLLKLVALKYDPIDRVKTTRKHGTNHTHKPIVLIVLIKAYSISINIDAIKQDENILLSFQ